MRYELKYKTRDISLAEIRSIILTHSAAFKKAFPDRIVNNIYFDTVDYHLYHENVNGNPHRKKLRLRWYGESGFTESNCVLETKFKVKQLGGKKVDTFDADVIRDIQNLENVINARKQFPFNLIATLQNKYLRSYFISHDGKFRITIDRQQQFCRPNPKNVYPADGSQFENILELKFDESDWEASHFITKEIPYRQSKNSKYVNGINHLFHI